MPLSTTMNQKSLVAQWEQWDQKKVPWMVEEEVKVSNSSLYAFFSLAGKHRKSKPQGHSSNFSTR